MEFRRYAVYYTPPPGPLQDFGARWLGWDPTAGRQVERPAIDDLPAPLTEITATPHRYGLHATVKPPFRLAEGCDAGALDLELARLCARVAPVRLPALEIAPLGRFLALMPRGNRAQLKLLAARMVQSLDEFRAPPTEAELAHRRAAGLSAEQDELLQRWGFPYVMEEYRFHITLSGKLPRAQAHRLREVLTPVLDPLLPRPFVIDGLSLMGEDGDGMFHVIHRHTFSG